MRRKGTASLMLFVIMTAVYVIEVGMSFNEHRRVSPTAEALAMAFAEGPEEFVEGNAITPDTLASHEWWRLASYIFLHGGLFHLLLNGWALLQFGLLLEKLRGSAVMLSVFLLSGVAAGVCSASFLHAQYSVGASGAIFGVAGALIVVMRRTSRAARLIRLQLLLWSIVTIVAGFTAEGIDNAAHIGGFAAGMLIGLALPAQRSADSRSSSSSSSSRARPTTNT